MIAFREMARRWMPYALAALFAHLTLIVVLILTWRTFNESLPRPQPQVATAWLLPPSSPAQPPTAIATHHPTIADKPAAPQTDPRVAVRPHSAIGARATRHDKLPETSAMLPQVTAQTEATPARPPTPLPAMPSVEQSVVIDAGATEAQHRWEAAVLAHLDRLKRYPGVAAWRGQQDVISVGVRVARTGEVLSAQIKESGGYPALNREAIALIERANPLPRPPADIPDEDLVFVLPIDFHIDRAAIGAW